MTRVLAAVDGSLAARPVVQTALELARVFGGTVEAVYVADGEEATARLAVEALGVPLTVLSGRPVGALVTVAAADDVAALVLGSRATPGGARPAGSTALAVAERLAKPVVLVPPDAAPRHLDRVLVPLEATVASSVTPRRMIELSAQAGLELVVLHVLDEASLPRFTDQPQHEAPAWAEEFLARYCPWGVEAVRLDVRVGRREEVVGQAAEEQDTDLVVLGWSRELASGRGPVVRRVLDRARIPVMLIPVDMAPGPSEPS